MHAYLISGDNQNLIKKEVDRIVSLKNAQILNYQIDKISKVRQLEHFTKLKIAKPTIILIENIQSASTAALNAFLKSLEEPQKNLTYVLTCNTIYNLLPTILSRCQIINLKKTKKINEGEEKRYHDFFLNSSGQKFQTLKEIKSRQEAVEFFEKLILFLHQMLHSNKEDKYTIAKALLAANQTYKALKLNGNVKLQLANFIVNL